MSHIRPGLRIIIALSSRLYCRAEEVKVKEHGCCSRHYIRSDDPFIKVVAIEPALLPPRNLQQGPPRKGTRGKPQRWAHA